MDTDFLDWALTDFSGYVAADELYDGPFCRLSVVDNRCYTGSSAPIQSTRSQLSSGIH